MKKLLAILSVLLVTVMINSSIALANPEAPATVAPYQNTKFQPPLGNLVLEKATKMGWVLVKLHEENGQVAVVLVPKNKKNSNSAAMSFVKELGKLGINATFSRDEKNTLVVVGYGKEN